MKTTTSISKKCDLTSPSDVTDRSDRKGLRVLRWFNGLRLLKGKGVKVVNNLSGLTTSEV